MWWVRQAPGEHEAEAQVLDGRAVHKQRRAPAAPMLRCRRRGEFLQGGPHPRIHPAHVEHINLPPQRNSAQWTGAQSQQTAGKPICSAFRVGSCLITNMVRQAAASAGERAVKWPETHGSSIAAPVCCTLVTWSARFESHLRDGKLPRHPRSSVAGQDCGGWAGIAVGGWVRRNCSGWVGGQELRWVGSCG